jgi:hypothetical protein
MQVADLTGEVPCFCWKKFRIPKNTDTERNMNTRLAAALSAIFFVLSYFSMTPFIIKPRIK